MVSKYKNWMSQQSQEFINEICGTNQITDIFQDFNYKSISLEELKALDDKFINNAPEG